MNFSEFPDDLAGVLVSLSHLDLADNQFERLPTAVMLLSKLQNLEMPRNVPLQLEEGDGDTLVGLPCLQRLDIKKSRTDWSESSVDAFVTISARLLSLELAFLADQQA